MTIYTVYTSGKCIYCVTKHELLHLKHNSRDVVSRAKTSHNVELGKHWFQWGIVMSIYDSYKTTLESQVFKG